METKQLPLGVDLRDECTLETYFAGDNAQALVQVKDLAKGVGELFIYLWGRAGVGRTHLLQGACQWAHRFQRTACYVSLASVYPQGPAILDGLERLDLICLDDLDAVVGVAAWEEGLFHLFNRLRAAHRQLLVAANVAPRALSIRLADLASRLSWGVVYQLQPLSDEALLMALQLRARERGLILSDEVATYLMRRYTRSMPQLYAVLEQLDRASLVAQRRLTIPFVKSVLCNLENQAK